MRAAPTSGVVGTRPAPRTDGAPPEPGAALADLAAVARDGGEPARTAALWALAAASGDPRAFGWFWVAARTRDARELGPAVDRLPAEVVLLPRVVLALADELAGPSCPDRAPAHAALLGRLRPGHEHTDDLATLVATAPRADPLVLAAALDLLVRAGHPSRAALVRAAARAIADDPGAVAYASAVAVSLLPAVGDREVALVERCEVVGGPLAVRAGRA